MWYIIRLLYAGVSNGLQFIVIFQTIGPFVVDTTPPQFQGQIVVLQELVSPDHVLIVRWDSDAFSDNGVVNKLTYQYAVGMYAYF